MQDAGANIANDKSAVPGYFGNGKLGFRAAIVAYPLVLLIQHIQKARQSRTICRATTPACSHQYPPQTVVPNGFPVQKRGADINSVHGGGVGGGC